MLDSEQDPQCGLRKYLQELRQVSQHRLDDELDYKDLYHQL